MPREWGRPLSVLSVPAAPSPTPRRRVTDHPGWSAALGAVVGALVVSALAALGALPSIPAPSRPVAAGGAVGDVAGSPAAAFLAAWRAHLAASWSVDEIDERTAASGAVIRFEIHRAQHPPDSVVVGNGTVAARRGSTELACGPGAGAALACRSAPARLTWAQDVDAQVAALRAELVGPRAVYRVGGAGDGCWTLSVVVPSAAVPVVLGLGATYCLDTTTWALRSSVIRRVGAVDRVTVASAHAPATAADLALPPGAAF